MIDIKDITEAFCDECDESLGREAGFIYTISDRRDQVFCSYECAIQAVNNYNVDYAERKADEKRYE